MQVIENELEGEKMGPPQSIDFTQINEMQGILEDPKFTVPRPISSLESEIKKMTITDDFYEESFSEFYNEAVVENYEEGTKNIVFSMVKQITKGMDLHRVNFPTFVLEPRSMLERMTDFMSHPQLILSTHKKKNSIDRFIDVVRYFLSGWHVRPKGVKKPYNPVLGEIFKCKWKNMDESSSFYIAEQVSHHPPISAYFFASEDNNIIATGNFKPKSRFLGNSVVSIMNGSSHIYFTNFPGEEYVIQNPNVYARGILFGTLCMEVGDSATIRCDLNDLRADIDFKTKGYFTGTYNAVSGKIKKISTGEILFNIYGKWTDIIYIIPVVQTTTYNVESKENSTMEVFQNKKNILFDANNTEVYSKLVPKIEKQDPMESRRLWRHVTDALLKRDYDKAAIEKSIIEENQRLISKSKEAKNKEWIPKFFSYDSSAGFWCFIERKLLLKSHLSVKKNISDFYSKNFQ